MPEKENAKNTGMIAGIIGGAVALIAIIVVVIIIIANNSGNIVGKYTIDSMTEGGTTIDAEKIKEYYGDEEWSIEFKDDNKCVMKGIGGRSEVECTYDKDKKKITAEGDDTDFTVDGDKITIKMDSSTSMTFKKK